MYNHQFNSANISLEVFLLYSGKGSVQMAERFRSQDNDELQNQTKLLSELNKIKQVERSDVRMLETGRQRFKSKLKRFEVRHFSSGSDAMDVRMYDTHNPGFCYHCNGVMRKSCDTSRRKKFVDVFDVVHSMIFTNGEVDPDKILCLHILAAHYAKSGFSEASEIRPITPLIEKGKRENFCGSWNSILPCYVLEIERNVNDITNFSDEMKRHKDPLVMEAEEEIVKDFLCKYEKYVEDNSEVGLALSINHKRTKMVPNGIGKTTIIPPHVYSLLGAAQELKIKQAIAEESRRKKFRRSNSSVKNVDDQSISFRLQDDEDDDISRRIMTATSIRGWNDPRIIAPSKVSTLQNLSRKSATFSHKNDPSITTLKRGSPRSGEVPTLLENVPTDTQIVTIKSSDRTMGRIVAKTSSTKSPFRNFSSIHSPGSPCSNSIVSGISGSFAEPRKILRPIFINFPIESFDLRNKGYRTVPILVNNQIQALVHSVLDVLERVNPSKMQKIIDTARSPYEIRKMLIRPDIQLFIDSLAYQPLISSPNSFVISFASIINEIDPRVESSIGKELVATTLAIPPTLGLHRVVEEIRNNLFVDPKQMIGSKVEMKIETFGHQKQKLLATRHPGKVPDAEKDVFDVDTSCQHSDFQETKMTCACCYAKWKNSLPDTERSKVPDFSFLVMSQDIENITPENTAKYETNTSETNARSIENEDTRKGLVDSDKEEKSRDVLSPSVKELKRGGNPRKGSKTSRILLSKEKSQQPHASLYSVDRTSRLSQNISGNKFFGRSIRTKQSRKKMNVDEINEVESHKGSTSISCLTATDCESMINRSLQKRCSKITLKDDAPSPKSQFKPWKASQNPSYLEPDRIILRRMTNPQRILVGQMCASLKTRKINMEGLVKERTPLAALITPVLSHEALRILTKGTRQGKSRKREIMEEEDDCVTIVSEELTGPVLAKVRQAVAENETNRRLKSFLNTRI